MHNPYLHLLILVNRIDSHSSADAWPLTWIRRREEAHKVCELQDAVANDGELFLGRVNADPVDDHMFCPERYLHIVNVSESIPDDAL